ncbi:hypothetical protein [Methylobacterium radiotolerans]|uniref:Uncharacterized protein n=1 Tax=Methylobacterium radiotolerans (strain ATCC 27329 / DSM 1819 / JCM 2831 / NBRC 15690 / NCIMB 10815 / 0-1) TaxID=426355 RepID=B1M9Y5_METRJ|nr:hypothetical protein [Methylobacterium radiotolerans]ACB28310.1 hypothetical protein Mrad2831_6389 [Methylobacterium radiotolerans JCM 2831]
MLPPQPLPLTLNPRQDIPFIFKSYRQLVRSLGAVDGLGAGLTVATKEFEKQISSIQPTTQQLPHALSIATAHNVSTAYIDMTSLSPHLSQLLIVATYQQTEFFLTNFRKEQKTLGRQWRDRADGEILLDYILSCLPQGLNRNIVRIWKERYQLIEYYRHVRNGFVHATINRASLANEYNKVSSLIPYVQHHYGLTAPNAYGSLTFDDHMLFTRLTKYIATDLCRIGAPSTGIEIVNMLFSDEYVSLISSLIQRKGDEPQLKKSLRGRLRADFNYNLKIYPQIERDILDWFSKIPPKRERREDGKISAIEAAKQLI